MSNDFVKEVYKVLNPIVDNWVDFHANYDEIIEYSSKRYRVFENFNKPIDDYNVRIELKNGYCIGITMEESRVSSYEKVNSLQVYALAPAVEKVDNNNGCIDTIPRKIMKERKIFVDGEFDIDSVDFNLDILNFLNKYAQKEKAEVEVLD